MIFDPPTMPANSLTGNLFSSRSAGTLTFTSATSSIINRLPELVERVERYTSETAKLQGVCAALNVEIHNVRERITENHRMQEGERRKVEAMEPHGKALAGLRVRPEDSRGGEAERGFGKERTNKRQRDEEDEVVDSERGYIVSPRRIPVPRLLSFTEAAKLSAMNDDVVPTPGQAREKELLQILRNRSSASASISMASIASTSRVTKPPAIPCVLAPVCLPAPPPPPTRPPRESQDAMFARQPGARRYETMRPSNRESTSYRNDWRRTYSSVRDASHDDWRDSRGSSSGSGSRRPDRRSTDSIESVVSIRSKRRGRVFEETGDRRSCYY